MAVSALTFLGADEERLDRFLAVTGLGPHNLRGAAEDPAFYGSVLQYLVADEQLLVHFAADAGLEPEAVARAHEALCARRIRASRDGFACAPLKALTRTITSRRRQ